MCGRNSIITVLFISFSLVILDACSTELSDVVVPDTREWLEIEAVANCFGTKTTIVDKEDHSSFSFQLGDAIGFFAQDRIKNVGLVCTNNNSDALFAGRTSAFSKDAAEDIEYYAYYPFSPTAGLDPSSLPGVLPMRQKAPYDPTVDFLVADVSTGDYYAGDFPDLSFNFRTHLFAIVKISIRNSEESYAGEKITAVGLESSGDILTGRFIFDATNPSKPVSFPNTPQEDNYKALVSFADGGRLLDLGKTHTVYAIVKAGSFKAEDLSLVVYTTNYKFTLPTKQAVSFSQNEVSVLPTVDLATVKARSGKRIMVLWGDSITSFAFHRDVQNVMGEEWVVVRGGVSGDSAYQVASRQGGLPMVTGSEFTLPASSNDYANIDDLYWRYYNADTKVYSYGHATHESTYGGGYCPLLNPIVVCGIECEVVYDKSSDQRSIHRLVDGNEDTVIPEHSFVSTYGSRAYADADVIAVYIGTNGRPTDDRLIELHDMMGSHLTNPDGKMFVYGFHQSTTIWPQYWNETYASTFKTHYGDYFIDLRTEGGGENAIPLMIDLGQIQNEGDISADDYEAIQNGDWPLSWYRGPGDIHPDGDTGSMVQAILLRRHMAKFKLL